HAPAPTRLTPLALHDALPISVAAFLAAEAKRGVKASTIGRRVAAIRYAHKLAGHEPPTNAESVKATVRGIRRSIGTAKARKTPRSEEHTSELQSRFDLVCRLL